MTLRWTIGKLAPLVFAAWAAACGPADSSERGAVQLSVTTGAAQVAQVVVTISPGDGSDFAPIAALASQDGAAWTLSVTGVLPGPQRLFEVVAYDGSGVVSLAGSTRADVSAGGPTAVFLLLQPPAPPTSTNSGPVIDAVWAAPAVVAPGATAALGATAHDPDAADNVSYWWMASCGAFDDATRASPLWTAPMTAGATCVVSITVSDLAGATVSTSFALAVQ